MSHSLLSYHRIITTGNNFRLEKNRNKLKLYIFFMDCSLIITFVLTVEMDVSFLFKVCFFLMYYLFVLCFSHHTAKSINFFFLLINVSGGLSCVAYDVQLLLVPPSASSVSVLCSL